MYRNTVHIEGIQTVPSETTYTHARADLAALCDKVAGSPSRSSSIAAAPRMLPWSTLANSAA